MKQLEYAKNLGTQTRAVNNELYLVAYTYQGVIESKTEIQPLMERLFAEDAVFVKYTNEETFEILALEELKQQDPDAGSDILTKLRSQLNELVDVGMDVIDLEWNYKGETFYSTAIASEELGGIIFDHIGYFIVGHTETVNKSAEYITYGQTYSDYNDPDAFFYKGDPIYNGFGVLVVEYQISCRSDFNEKGILFNRDMHAFHYSAVLWSCDAQIRTISGALHQSSHHEFAWGYVYSSLGWVSLSFNGFSFSFSGGGTGETGVTVHNGRCPEGYKRNNAGRCVEVV